MEGLVLDELAAVKFLEDIFARVPMDQWISCFCFDRTAEASSAAARKTIWGPVGELHQLVADLAPLAPTHCIWFGVATRRARITGRGRAEDCSYIPGFWADLDVTGPGHHSTKLPPDEAAALSMLAEFDEASMVVRTGGGLQPYWLFDEPLPAPIAKSYLDAWAYKWGGVADKRGWAVDNVWDVARVLRLVGSYNLKDPANPKLVVLK